MSDQSLRDALERIARGNVPLDTPASHFARAALAAHPAEPAPVVTDEAVEDLHAGVVTQFRRHGQYTLADARAALEAAAPLLGPRPLLDREALVRALKDHKIGNDAYRQHVADAVLPLARPMPTQAELADWLRETFSTDRAPGVTTWDSAAGELLALLNGAES